MIDELVVLMCNLAAKKSAAKWGWELQGARAKYILSHQLP